MKKKQPTVEGDPFPELRLRDGGEVVVGDVEPDGGAGGAEPPDVAEVAVEEDVRRPAHALRPEPPRHLARTPHSCTSASNTHDASAAATAAESSHPHSYPIQGLFYW
jgi:hypothetical protein